MKKLFVLVVGLTFSLAAISTISVSPVMAAKKSSKKLKIKSFTGQIQIKLADGSIIGVVPGAEMPDIPVGAEVVVISGEAVFESGGTVITASAGDSFSFTADAGGVQIAATGSKTEITVTVGKTEATVTSGDAVTVKGSGQGGGELKVTAGEVVVVSGGKTQTLSVGETVATAPATGNPTQEAPPGDAPPVDDASPEDDAPEDAPPADDPAVDNPNQNEAVEDEEGIVTDDVSPSSP